MCDVATNANVMPVRLPIVAKLFISACDACIISAIIPLEMRAPILCKIMPPNKKMNASIKRFFNPNHQQIHCSQ